MSSQDITLVTVKEELLDNITVEEHDIALALTKSQDNPVCKHNLNKVNSTQTPISNYSQNENIQIEIKEECIDQDDTKKAHSNSSSMSLALEVKKDFKLEETETDEHHPVKVKEEIQMDENVTYDFPNFNNAGMGSYNVMTVLGNVEACLEDVTIKCEKDLEYNVNYPTSDIKMEYMTTTESHLTATSSLLVPLDSVGHPHKLPLMKICKNENGMSEVVQGKFEDAYDTSIPYLEARVPSTDTDAFQLNSITGDVQTLEQQAFGAVDPKPITCPLCPKKYKSRYTLRKHLIVHETIQKNISSRIHGITKCIQTKAERRKLREQKKVKANAEYLANLREPPIKYEGHKCTCGEVFKRRTRMESCLKSHAYILKSPVVKCFTCTTCKKQYKSQEDFLTHRQNVHRKKFPCKFCPTDYINKSLLFRHLQIHQKVQILEYKVISEVVEGKQVLHCFMCSKQCNELGELKSHVMIEHKRPYTCPYCQNIFPKMHDFANHIKAEHPKISGHLILDVLEAFSKLVKDWHCEECNIQFAEPDKLAIHQINNHSPDVDIDGSARSQCIDCRRIFVSQKALASHRRVHHKSADEEDKDLVDGIMCLECRKICKDITALTSHMRLHSQDRKFPCRFCGFRFATKEKRKTHAEIHTGDMKFVCFICEYQCSSYRKLKLHKNSKKHFDMQEYLLTGKPSEQESTSKTDNSKPQKKKAKQRKHSDGIKTIINSNTKEKAGDNEQLEASSSSSDEEEQTKSAVCDICGEKFSNYTTMIKHKQSHPFIEFIVDGEDKPERIFFK